MGDSASVDKILEFMRKNKFMRAEAALRNELNNRRDMNDVLQKLSFEDKEELNKILEDKNGYKKRDIIDSRGNNGVFVESSSRSPSETSKELIIKEVECGFKEHGSDVKWKGTVSVGGQNKVDESVGTSDKNIAFMTSDDAIIDMYTWKNDPGSGPYENNGGTASLNNLPGSQASVQSRVSLKDTSDGGKLSVTDDFTVERRITWPKDIGNTKFAPLQDKVQITKLKEVDPQTKLKGILPMDELMTDKMWAKGNGPSNISSNQWKDFPVKTIFPFSEIAASTSYENNAGVVDKRTEKETIKVAGIKSAIKEEVDEVGRALYLGKIQQSQSDTSSLMYPFAPENEKEELPRLPHVKLKSDDKPSRIHWEGYKHDGQTLNVTHADNTYLIGSYLDVPIGQEINTSGDQRAGGGSWLSVSQGIVEDTSGLVSGFAPIGDGFPTEYWDSDEFDDDDDVGYTRQPIEDEDWFLAHEIDYPSDNGKPPGHGSLPDSQERVQNQDDDDQSFVEEDSYFSGEHYIESRNIDLTRPSDDPTGISISEMYGTNENDFIGQYDGQLMDEEELKLMRAEPGWQGFVTRTNELLLLDDDNILNECGRLRLEDIPMDDDQHGSVRSIGVGINSDAADIGSEVRDSLVGGSSEGDIEYFQDHGVGFDGSRQSKHGSDKTCFDKSSKVKKESTRSSSDMFIRAVDKDASTLVKNQTDGGFSFPPPKDGQLVQTQSSNSLWSNKRNGIEVADNGLGSNAPMLASSRHKSSGSSLFESSRNENNIGATDSENSSPSSLSNYALAEHLNKEQCSGIESRRESDNAITLEDEEAAAVQEQVKQIKAQEEEFETFELKIVHRKNRTGFEEDKNFHVVLNSVIAGRYHVTEYLGSAAFSKAIQAHDLHTGMDVCVKIIKNNKDFFDQSLDEIKLLKFINKHDPGDKYHVLRLYDYFYYREHLLIVCELLKANLYEFHKFNRESGGEVYFTMPRLQSITIQCLEALQFLHGLGLIHCDLKPENILVKSYSRCEVKVIDLGSSCYETDNLCSYVQSRSYRAPEVILGLSYDKKIDIWSLGCILAELCTGNVLFQNDSPATLLARVLGIVGPIDQGMLAKGTDTYKYFTKNHMLYERNQESNRLEYLVPKKTSLRHRLPMGDQGFIDFVTHLLEINPKRRPSAAEALKHPWLSYPYEPISS
ncbi:protein modifying enzyme [Lithospermum erythrorhizon]|uniref:Protein modifying enzyme n=1 Tax=Lithospermum erythrorhizon TaxID=34254 RepID=A0AAV3RKI2_LITER